mgnify:CR=1 FL=1
MILLTGANGQLGQDFRKLFDRLGVDYIATHRTAVGGCAALDITDGKAVEEAVRSIGPRIIINCAAYNDVDRAEREREQAFRLNRDAPAHLAREAKRCGAVFVTFSTDFVFDGRQRTPYKETDAPNPLNVYGESKLQGERAVLSEYDRVYVIRTSWAYGLGNKNFTKSVIQWAREKSELSIVDDQVSSPTYTKDLAEFTWRLAQSGQYGLYHLSNGGEASKFDQAQYVLDRIGWQGRLRRAKTSDFPLPARRAEYTKLDSAKAEGVVGRPMPPWRDALDRFLREMKEAGELA